MRAALGIHSFDAACAAPMISRAQRLDPQPQVMVPEACRMTLIKSGVAAAGPPKEARGTLNKPQPCAPRVTRNYAGTAKRTRDCSMRAEAEALDSVPARTRSWSLARTGYLILNPRSRARVRMGLMSMQSAADDDELTESLPSKIRGVTMSRV
ncbi:hypothetical protein HWV62_15913 [Athelia sp. TMB]|nr:hypothetical protein HWV62_15913 [Athelia sp. TMB]